MKAKTVNNFLFEMAIEAVDIKDVVTKDLINQYLGDDFVLDLFCYSFSNENNLDYTKLQEDEEFKQSKEFRNWVIYEIECKFHETRDKFKYEIIDGNEITIWRKMKVEKNWLKHLEKQGNRLGIYWSWDPDVAEPHWGYDIKGKEKEIMIESSIGIEYINWIETLRVNMHPLYEDEKEIRLFKNTPLKIIAIYDQNSYENGVEMKISSQIKNKIFKA